MILCCVLLALATLGIYARILHHPFINYDDDVYVLNNSHVNTGLTWHNVNWALTSTAAANWHPITWISHFLDFQLFGLNAGGHHATSLLLHVLNVVLLFVMLCTVTGAAGRSFLVAGLFALHPLNVESVAWVAERKNLLCALFLLLALAAYGWYARRPGLNRYIAVILLFALGLASKPMVITLPLVLLLLDFWPLGRISRWSAPSPAFQVPQTSFSRLALEKLPLMALSVGSAIITIIAQRRASALTSVSGWTMSWRIENAVHSYAIYLWKAFLPRRLAPFYPGMILQNSQVALASVFLLALIWLVWRLSPSRPYLVTGGLWFLGMLIPVIGLVQVGSQSMADRYSYLPLIGIFTAVVWGACEAAKSNGIALKWSIVPATVVLTALSFLSWRQIGYWRSSLDLWTHALQVTANNYVAEENLAMVLEGLGRDNEALPHFVNAKKIRPDDSLASLHIGTTVERMGFHQEAIAEFEDVLRTTNEPLALTAAYRGLGVAYAQLGNRNKARENFLRAVQLSPEGSAELYNLSLLEIQDGVDKLSRLVSIHPTAQGYRQLGDLFHEEHDIPHARVAYEKALRLNPRHTKATQALQDLKSSAE